MKWKQLIVEDDHLNAEAASDYFSSKGWEVETKADGKRAVECVYSRKERYLKTGYSSHPLGMALFHAAGSPCRKRKMKKTGTGTASALRRWTMSIL